MHGLACMQSRREFLVSVASACVTAGAVIACGGGSDPSPDPDPDDMDDQPPDNPTTPDGGTQQGVSCVDNGTSSTIRDNHGHVLTVSKEDVRAGVTRTYNIRGTSDHPHNVTVTDTHFATLARNEAVTITSTTDVGHSHVVRVMCL
jgi:hypothetical protein